jgi:hypothetical protein
MGMAIGSHNSFLLLLFIEVERSTRQAAARLSRNRGESPLEITELADEPE